MLKDKRQEFKASHPDIVKSLPIQSDNPYVEMTKLKLDAIKSLADSDNAIFSQHNVSTYTGIDETIGFEKACLFAKTPLPGLEKRLQEHGITTKVQKIFDGEIIEDRDEPVKISIPIIHMFVDGILKRRHSTNRKRVDEFIDALDKTGRNNENPIQQKTSILSRL